MSDFKCEVVQINSISRHPNADKLAICKIKGYDCITADLEDGSARYKVGDYVVYIPEAAVVPEWLLKKMGFWDEEKQKGTLSGPKGNRVKACKLRGIVSQGLMYPVRKEEDEVYHVDCKDNSYTILEFDGTLDMSEELGITKYEPPVPAHMAGMVTGNLFGYTKSYDVESIQKAPEVFAEGEEVVVTEKLHGTLCQIGFLKDAPEKAYSDTFDIGSGIRAFVTSKGLAGKGLVQANSEANGDNLYVKVFKEYFVNNEERLQAVRDFFEHFTAIDRLYVFGEIFGPGIQKGFHYGKKTPTLRVFDLYVHFKEPEDTEGYFLRTGNRKLVLQEFKLDGVPILYEGPFHKETMHELANNPVTTEGNNAHMQEGVVIEAKGSKFYKGLPDNRAKVKWVSEKYLLKSTGEEFN